MSASHEAPGSGAAPPPRTRILLIGSLPPPLGGTAVSFRQLLRELRERDDVHVLSIDTSRGGATGAASALVSAGRILARALRCVPRADVVTFHASPPGLVGFGLVLHGLCRMMRRPFLFRGFGGSFDFEVEEMSPRAQRVVATVFRSHRVLLQTHQLVEAFRRRFPEARLEWFPTSRPVRLEEQDEKPRRTARRFVFIGHVKPTKGLREILAAAREPGLDGCSVDVYGPLLDGMGAEDFRESARVSYRGVLEPDDVIPTLRRYDAALLPTYHYGEGYPGIVLEAYSAGVPVIASRFRAIPEIVEEGVSGLLVEPRDAGSLARAMEQLVASPDLLARLEAGARAQARLFDSRRWTGRFVEICREEVAHGR